MQNINSYWKSISFALLVLMLCGINFDNEEVGQWIFLRIVHFDKIFHGFLYFILALLVLNDLRKSNKFRILHQYILTFLICTVYGLGIELVQMHIFFGRSGEVLDFISNIGGTLFALANFFILVDFKQQPGNQG